MRRARCLRALQPRHGAAGAARTGGCLAYPRHARTSGAQRAPSRSQAVWPRGAAVCSRHVGDAAARGRPGKGGSGGAEPGAMEGTLEQHLEDT